MPSRRRPPAHATPRHENSKRSSRLPRLLRGEPLESRTLLSSVGLSVGPSVPCAGPQRFGRLCQSQSRTDRRQGGQPGHRGQRHRQVGQPYRPWQRCRGATSTLTYTWKVSSAPSGGTATFSVNGTNSAQNDAITFSKAGSYGVVVTITDASGLSVSSSLQINVVSSLASIAVYPLGAKVAVGSGTLKVTGTSESLTATAFDQFGNPLASQPGFTWSTTSSPGATPKLVSSGGNVTVTFTKAGSYTESVSATVNGVKLSTATSISVVAEPGLLCRHHGRQQHGDGHVGQIHGEPVLRPVPQPDVERHHAQMDGDDVAVGRLVADLQHRGSTTTVTFSSAGKYVFSVTESDQAGDTVTELVSVPVAQTLTTIKVTPGTASLQTGGTQQFQAAAYDQFQKAMSAPSAYTWTTSGGSITTSGLFTAQSAAATDTITAKTGGLSGTATVTVTAPSPRPAESVAVAQPVAFPGTELSGRRRWARSLPVSMPAERSAATTCSRSSTPWRPRARSAPPTSPT